MHADPLELPSHPPIEVRHPDAPNVIVRVGPTLTHVMGFGPSGEVASWLADALVTPSYIVTSDAIDEARLAFEAQGHSQISAYEADLDRLEATALAIEQRLEVPNSCALSQTTDVAVEAEAKVAVANAARLLAFEWDKLRVRILRCDAPILSGPDSVAPMRERTPVAESEVARLADATDRVLDAHIAVERARSALSDAKWSDRKSFLKTLTTLEASERDALRAAGATTYSEYLMSLQAQNGSLGALRSTFKASSLAAPTADDVEGSQVMSTDGVGPAPTIPVHDAEIELRARTAQMLGRLPGADPGAELRAFTESLTQTSLPANDPRERERLVAELAEIDRAGQKLADLMAMSDETRIPSDHELIELAFPAAATNLIVDGDLLYAVAPDTRDLILDYLRDAIFERRVILVSDDTLLENWVDTIPHGMLWSSGHLHLVTSEDVVWNDDPLERSAVIVANNRPTDPLAVCTNHPGSATRLACPRCGLPYCSLCLISLDRKATVECVGCALGRSGVRARRWRS